MGGNCLRIKELRGSGFPFFPIYFPFSPPGPQSTVRYFSQSTQFLISLTHSFTHSILSVLASQSIEHKSKSQEDEEEEKKLNLQSRK